MLREQTRCLLIQLRNLLLDQIATLPSGKHLASWDGVGPGDEECAGVSRSHNSPKATRICDACLTDAPMLQSKQSQYLPDLVPPLVAPLRTQSIDLGRCPQALPPDLDDSAGRPKL
jgi:hypothetical protein